MKATAKKQKALPLTSDFVRYLGAFERLHWLFSQSGSRLRTRHRGDGHNGGELFPPIQWSEELQ
jgi:hypothetical protein